MSFGIVGAAVGTAVVGGYMANQAADKQARATRDAAKIGAAAADPFANQRGFYQQILRNVYSGGDSSGLNLTSPGGTTTTGSQYYGDGGTATFRETPFNPVLDFIQNSPDYQFRFNEGQRAVERSAASKGMFQSGNLLRDLTSFGQGQASQAYESEINRIMTMAGATVGSPGVAGQIAASGGANAASIRAEGTNTALQQVGYGLAGAFNQFNQPTTANSGIAGQTGYQGGASGVLSGDEFASWG